MTGIARSAPRRAHLAPAQAAVGTLVLPRRLFSRRNSVMNVRDERTRSLWMDISVADAPALSRAERADVAVIGSGIAGLSVAYELANRGRSVVVLDRGGIGSGMTARTTAHLATALDDGYDELLRVRGHDCARHYYQSIVTAMDRAEAIQRAEKIDCDFRRVDGYWMLAPETPESELDRPASSHNLCRPTLC
jgi:hypothetical protein